MKSQLDSLMGINKAKEVEAKIKSDVQAKTQEPTFFQKHLSDVHSGKAQTAYDKAVATGKEAAGKFMNIIHDSTHPQHLETVKTYKNEYGMDQGKLYEACIDKACLENDAPSPEELKENPAYEESVLNALKPQNGKVTIDSLAFHEILKSNLKKSRDKRGYGKNKKHDQEVINDWANTYNK